MDKISWKQALVVGASSGIGAALAQRLAAGGCQVALVARRQAELARLCEAINAGGAVRAHAYPHDVQSVKEVPALFQQIAADLGGLDLVIYAAGVMPRVAPDEYDTEKDRLIIEVNVIGAMAWLNEAARRFERAGAGTIVGISSIAADRGRRGNPAYGASKAALDHFLEALRNRLSRRGVTVVTIKPGFVDTEMTQGMPGLFWLISADEAARRILAAARRGPVTVYVPRRWRMVGLTLRSIPSFLFRRLKI